MAMSDILIRDVPEATVIEIDRRAGALGISRSEFLRRWLDQGIRPAEPVTVDDLRRVSRLASDLADPDVMRKAWS
jgi:Ribbon-helix-helix protein, copG family